MRAFLASFLVICAAVLCCGEDKVNVPKGVKYKAAPKELNEQAKQIIQDVFKNSPADADVRKLLGRHLICGPALWTAVKVDGRLASFTNGVMRIKMPVVKGGKLAATQEAEGKLFQGEDEVSAFWSVLKSTCRFDDANVRRASALELQFFWKMIPFDAIEEPVFVVETGEHKFFLNLSKTKLTLLWIDDYQHVSFVEDKLPNRR